MASSGTKLPSIPPIPSDVDPKLKTYLNAVDEALKVRLGTLGDPKDRAVTVRELIDTGLAENFLENPFNPNAGTPDNTFIPTQRVDVTIPPDVTGFSGTGAFQKIILSWDPIQFGNFAFTEVWRHTSNDIGSATRIDTTRTSVYADTVDLNSDFYYWVRHVSTSNIEGQFTNGINVTTSKVSSSNVTDFFVADAITAASGVIADAAIGTAQIDDAAITNAKVNDLSAAKINAGFLNADRITANSVNGVLKGTAHSFSTIKVETQSTAIVSDIDRDGTILNNVGGSHVCYGYRCVVEDNMRFGNTFGASTPYFAYNKLYNGSYYNIHLKRLGSVSFTVISNTQGVYAGQIQTTFFGSYTGDERLFITASFGTTGTTQSTYVASETNGSGATGTTTSTQFDKGSSWVDFHNMGSSGAQMRMSFNSFYLTAGTYHLNVWGGVSLAGPNSQGQHQFDTTLISVFKQHI
jgi:hypothetical protein